MIKLLLLSYKGININIQDKWEFTALIDSATHNNIEILKLLLNRPGINIFLKNYEGKTALDWAKLNNNKEIETLLINYDRKEKLKLLKHV
jgi:ankyrin repeat protein